MATQTIKQRFLDILFEADDEDEIRYDEQKKVSRPAPRVKASDLLYAKKETKQEPRKETEKVVSKETIVESKPKSNNTFINYGEETKIEENKSEVRSPSLEEIYISQPALSPIFGNVEKDKKNKEKDTVAVNYASVDKPNSNHLGIVLSPIYGYDSANIVTNTKQETKPVKEEIKDKDITEDLGDIFATDEFKQEAFKEEEKQEEKTSEIDLFSDFYTTKD